MFKPQKYNLQNIYTIHNHQIGNIILNFNQEINNKYKLMFL